MNLQRRTTRWFVIAGCIGIAISTLISIFRPDNPALVLCLWPSSIVGLADPSGLRNQIIFGVFMFGGQFLLYGVLGLVAGFAADRR